MFKEILQMAPYRRFWWDIDRIVDHSQEQLTNIETIHYNLLLTLNKNAMVKDQNAFNLIRAEFRVMIHELSEGGNAMIIHKFLELARERGRLTVSKD
jgi:hypothetical protein